ncbi:hypothetical protein OED52_04965 [Rhodococcus sp. Z13]|uniref:Uncharacterized protein n=1 Tax=Rhodococcus sacchari TaxID=2962047 RepID=A0ACD4DIW5_9NOCA|nr:hypothetical protein [Rhodococcus sp. Z13]UYP19908.1 hypothetical protein OED52_04965 [Rhodococcus sp. Z13]
MSQNPHVDVPLFLAPRDPRAEAESEPIANTAEVTRPHDYTSIFSARP